MFKSIVLLSLLFFPYCDKSVTKIITVYNECFRDEYELLVGDYISRLIAKKDNSIIEIFNNRDNPYLSQDYDYYFYANDGLNNYHLGMIENKIINLDSNRELQVSEKARSGGDIYSSLIGISYSNIPSTATFCDYPYYFEHLPNSGYGDNINGTCCIISMQILFDYYDAIYHEDVIPLLYDVDKSGYYAYCNQFPESPCSLGDSFHTYLITQCHSYLNCDGTNMSWGYQSVFIDYYIGTKRGLSHTSNTCLGYPTDVLTGLQFQVVQNGIDSGRPVILNNLGHSMVAFAYDNDYVYLMTGWKNNQKIAKMDWDDYNGNLFYNYPGAYDLIITTNHVCTESYYSTLTSQYLCPYCE